jgi:hypothetical protein
MCPENAGEELRCNFILIIVATFLLGALLHTYSAEGDIFEGWFFG